MALFFLVVLALLGSALLRHPDTPLPPRWNVFEPLAISDPITPVTSWKLDWAASDPKLCQQVLSEAARFDELPSIQNSPNCGIDARMSVSRIGAAKLEALETACPTALRLAMWEHHGVQPAAREVLGTEVARIRHFGSYNCRKIAGTDRWSTHSTASSIDISGFDLRNGDRVRLLKDWQKDGPKAQFLRLVRDAACDWFGTTLGPDYNAAHADHFHLQNRGWGTCR